MRLTGSCREGQLCGLGRMWAKGIAMGHRLVCPSLIHDHERAPIWGGEVLHEG
jgi:hypothetical protein